MDIRAFSLVLCAKVDIRRKPQQEIYSASSELNRGQLHFLKTKPYKYLQAFTQGAFYMEQPVENTAQPINTAGAGEYWGLVQSAHKVLVDADNAAAYVGLLPYADILRATQPESTKPADRQVAYWIRKC